MVVDPAFEGGLDFVDEVTGEEVVEGERFFGTLDTDLVAWVVVDAAAFFEVDFCELIAGVGCFFE